MFKVLVMGLDRIWGSKSDPLWQIPWCRVSGNKVKNVSAFYFLIALIEYKPHETEPNVSVYVFLSGCMA